MIFWKLKVAATDFLGFSDLSLLGRRFYVAGFAFWPVDTRISAKDALVD